MFSHHRTRAFILKKEKSREADQFLWVYSKDWGRLRILGRGLNKMDSKLRSGTGLFSLAEIEFIQGKSQKVLTDAICLESFPRRKESLGALRLLFRIEKLFLVLVTGQEADARLWRLLETTWAALGQKEMPPVQGSLFYLHFFWRLVSLLGYKPELHRCVVCRRPLFPPIFFLPEQGGLAGKDCAAKTGALARKVSVDAVKVWRFLLGQPWRVLARINLTPGLLVELKTIQLDQVNQMRRHIKKHEQN